MPLRLTKDEHVTVVSDAPDALEVEATYGADGSAPPAHLHPEQDERFEVLEGELTTKVDGHQRTLRSGDTLEVPRGTRHQMWNAGAHAARVRWTTTPAGRTLDWFRALDRLQRTAPKARISRRGRTARTGFTKPGPLAFAVLLNEYRDVFRLAGPDPLLRGVFAALAPLGRLKGYGALTSGGSPDGT
jgi:quercetin dioxygenase-like cupin family protein